MILETRLQAGHANLLPDIILETGLQAGHAIILEDMILDTFLKNKTLSGSSYDRPAGSRFLKA